MKLGFNKDMKVTVHIFEENSYYAQLGKLIILDSKSKLFIFSLNVFFIYIQSWYLLADIKKCVKVTVLDFYGKSLSCPKWENGTFLCSKSTFSLNMLIRHF